MDKFCNEHLALCNKNSPIHVCLGKKINDLMFDTRLTELNIKQLLHKIKEISKFDVESSYTEIIQYKIKNEIYYKSNGVLTTYSYNIEDSYMNDKYYIQKLIVNIDNITPISINKYDSMEIFSQMIIAINNQFDIEINHYDKQDEYFSVKLILKKPIFKNILIDYLEKLVL